MYKYFLDHQGMVHPEKYLPSRYRSNISQLDKPIYFYEHVGEEGDKLTIYAGLNYPDVGAWNDRISSILMAPRTKVYAYEHGYYNKYYAGEKKEFENTSTDLWRYIDLVEYEFNDIISSVKTTTI
jgi:hypothetical protein